ncbi:hypothetical protein HDU97_006831 [Phlyctochytrium planicorne]|nr:hypothetical protein HDU97_006831 [Phlyctochytrium planicorne]
MGVDSDKSCSLKAQIGKSRMETYRSLEAQLMDAYESLPGNVTKSNRVPGAEGLEVFFQIARVHGLEGLEMKDPDGLLNTEHCIMFAFYHGMCLLLHWSRLRFRGLLARDEIYWAESSSRLGSICIGWNGRFVGRVSQAVVYTTQPKRLHQRQPFDRPTSIRLFLSAKACMTSLTSLILAESFLIVVGKVKMLAKGHPVIWKCLLETYLIAKAAFNSGFSTNPSLKSIAEQPWLKSVLRQNLDDEKEMDKRESAMVVSDSVDLIELSIPMTKAMLADESNALQGFSGILEILRDCVVLEKCQKRWLLQDKGGMEKTEIGEVLDALKANWPENFDAPTSRAMGLVAAEANFLESLRRQPDSSKSKVKEEEISRRVMEEESAHLQRVETFLYQMVNPKPVE